MRFQNKQLIAAVSALALIAATPGTAAISDWGNVTAGQESKGWPNDGYGADNGAGASDAVGTGIGSGTTAVGKYQILIENWQNLGYIEPGASDWDQAVFTDKAKNMGVNSYNDLLMTSAGKVVQDSMASELASNMWGSLNSNATGGIGQTINGVQINEAGLLGGAWFLGPNAMNEWADSGFSEAGLANLDNIGEILSANGFTSTDQLQNYLMGRMEDFEGVDITEITDGTYVPGDGTATAFLVECDPELAAALQKQSQAYVEGIVAAAQDDTMGFSQMQETFGKMSCIDFAFTGGLDVLFSVPSLSDLAEKAMEMACGKVNGMVAQQTGKLTNAMQQVASEVDAVGPSMGPLGNFGSLNTSMNNQGSFNIGVNDANTGSYGGGTSYGGLDTGGSSVNDVADGGLGGLFAKK